MTKTAALTLAVCGIALATVQTAEAGHHWGYGYWNPCICAPATAQAPAPATPAPVPAPVAAAYPAYDGCYGGAYYGYGYSNGYSSDWRRWDTANYHGIPTY